MITVPTASSSPLSHEHVCEEEEHRVGEGDGSSQTNCVDGCAGSGAPPHLQQQKELVGLAGDGIRDFEPRQPAFGKMTGIVHDHYKGIWTSVSKVPQPVKDTWFEEFEKSFYWVVATEQMRKTFHQAGLHIVNIFKAHRRNNKRPSFLTEQQWTSIENKRKTDPDMIKQSEVNKRNRASQNAIDAGVFRGGSCKVSKWMKKLEKDNGTKPTISDVVGKLWKNKDGTWSGSRPAAIVEFNRLASQYAFPIASDGASRESITRAIETELWVQACKGPHRGRIFALGEKATALIRTGIATTHNTSAESSSASQVLQEVVMPLKEEIKEIRAELRAANAANEKLQAELRATNEILLEFMQQQQQSLLGPLLQLQGGQVPSTSTYHPGMTISPEPDRHPTRKSRRKPEKSRVSR